MADVVDYKLILTKEEIDQGVQRVADEIEQKFKGHIIIYQHPNALIRSKAGVRVREECVCMGAWV